MKRHLIAALFVLLPSLALAQAAEPRLTLGESAERELVQDRLTVSLRVEATAATAAAVQADVNRRMEAALARARAVSGIRVETTGYWTYEERPANQPRRWRGQAGLNLVGSDTGAVLALAGALQFGQQHGAVTAGDGEPVVERRARHARPGYDPAAQRLDALAAQLEPGAGERA